MCLDKCTRMIFHFLKRSCFILGKMNTILSSKYHVIIFQLFTNCTNDNPLVNTLWNKAQSSPIHPFRAVRLFSCTSTQSHTSWSLRHVEDDLPSGVTLFHLFVGFVCLHKRKLFVNNRSDLKYKTRMINFSLSFTPITFNQHLFSFHSFKGFSILY